MKFTRIVLALAAITIAAPAISNAQATWPGLPTPIAQASSEKSNHDDDVCGLRSYAGRTSSLPEGSTSSLGSRNQRRSLKSLSSTATVPCPFPPRRSA